MFIIDICKIFVKGIYSKFGILLILFFKIVNSNWFIKEEKEYGMMGLYI